MTKPKTQDQIDALAARVTKVESTAQSAKDRSTVAATVATAASKAATSAQITADAARNLADAGHGGAAL